MTIKQLKEMDFFELKLLADKKGIFYVRDGEVFVYQGNDKIVIDIEQSKEAEPTEEISSLKEKLPKSNPSFYIGENKGESLDPTKDTKENGYFWFWQKEEYFVLCFVTESTRTHKGTVYMIKAGDATDSL